MIFITTEEDQEININVTSLWMKGDKLIINCLGSDIGEIYKKGKQWNLHLNKNYYDDDRDYYFKIKTIEILL